MTLWHLFQRLDELREYILCVEELHACLSEIKLGRGLLGLREYVDEIYNEAGFSAMKQDMEKLTIKASEIRSITVGINVNDKLEATGLGLISVNDKPFKKSGIISGFSDAISSEDKLQKGNEWGAEIYIIILWKERRYIFQNAEKRRRGILRFGELPYRCSHQIRS